MKKNGFIATSLIYSFFLIFVTLFLSIIADYLQNKVYLNEIEKGIKDEINDSMGIRDFEVGDLIVFLNDCNSVDFDVDNAYIVANTDVFSKRLILYSYSLCDNSSSGCDTNSSDEITILNNFDDIPDGYKNATYYNKIIYSFDKSDGKTVYKVGSDFYSIDNNRSCTDGNFNTSTGCFVGTVGTSTYVRLREGYSISNRITKCPNTEADYMGAIYLQK